MKVFLMRGRVRMESDTSPSNQKGNDPTQKALPLPQPLSIQLCTMATVDDDKLLYSAESGKEEGSESRSLDVWQCS